MKKWLKWWFLCLLFSFILIVIVGIALYCIYPIPMEELFFTR